jgi:hypothetical protein
MERPSSVTLFAWMESTENKDDPAVSLRRQTLQSQRCTTIAERKSDSGIVWYGI